MTAMTATSARKLRCVGAIATYLNAGLWGSRFIGDCEVSTNGERVWLKGRRVPAWVSWMRVLSYFAFIPVGFYTGWILGETLLGHWGYPPYYYLLAALMSFLLVVLGLWGAGIWTESLSSYDVVSWPATKGLTRTVGRGATEGDTVWRQTATPRAQGTRHRDQHGDACSVGSLLRRSEPYHAG
jgi:hypothetical protein